MYHNEKHVEILRVKVCNFACLLDARQDSQIIEVYHKTKKEISKKKKKKRQITIPQISLQNSYSLTHHEIKAYLVKQ